MIKNVGKEDLCQNSLTGIRSLALLGLLIKAPRTLTEIRNAFLEYNIMEDSNSDDMLRIDINTLRKIGCTISRADHRTNNKFVLRDHPFKLDISKEEVSVIKRAFNKIKENADLSVLILYDNLLKKIAPHVANQEVQEALLDITPLKKYSSDILDVLKTACDKKEVVKFIYRTPAPGVETEKEIYADCIKLQNDKLYIYGVDKSSDKPIYLNIKRILKVISAGKSDENHTADPVVVRFKLKEFGIMGLFDNEEIESGDVANGFVIKGQYHNSFYAVQRILSFGSKCIVIEPEDFKEKIIEVLKKMKEVYHG